MYPGFDEGSNPGPYTSPKNNAPIKRKNSLSKEVQELLVDLKKYNMTSVKPLFNAYEVYFKMTAKSSPINPLPMKAVIFENYPAERPRIYVTRALGHKLINETNGEIKYEELVPWTPKTRLLDVLQKLQAAFNSSDIKEDPFTEYVEKYKKKLEDYAREVNNLTNTPIPSNPKEPFLQTLNLPQPPKFDFTYLLKEKEYQQKLQNQVEDNNAIYKTLLVDYRQNQAKAKYISERFGKGRILKEMESAMECGEPNPAIQGIENQLADFHARRKNYHRMEILKQKYLDS